MSIYTPRIGLGTDVHAFCPGDHLWLGGIKIPFLLGLAGDSDADVLLHALADAIFGALGEGDLGMHFPPDPVKWKTLTSSSIIETCMRLVHNHQAKIYNVDLILIGEEPKLKPYKDAIQKKIADLLNVPKRVVNLKATTTDGLGFTGRKEGLAAQAVICLGIPEV